MTMTREEFIKEYKFGEELLDYYGDDLGEAMEAVEENYLGEYESLEDYARESVDISWVPENILMYIDYDSMASDWELSGDIIVFKVGYRQVHVFSSH
jgi:antirestriction protein